MFEPLEVAGKDGGVQAQLRRTQDQFVGLQIPPQRVAGLIEKVAAVLGVALRPEEGDDLVAAHTFVASSGEQREEREGLALRGGTRPGRAIARDGESAERPEFDHRASFEPLLIGPSSLRPNLAPTLCQSEKHHGTAPSGMGQLTLDEGDGCAALHTKDAQEPNHATHRT